MDRAARCDHRVTAEERALVVLYLPPKGLGAPKHSIENFAEYAAGHWGFEPGGSVEEVVHRAGGKIVVGSSGKGDGESGSIIARAINDFTIYISRNTSRQRDRFTIAQELGHLSMHLNAILQQNPAAVMRATRWVDESDPDQRRAEWEANWFAAAFLMPRSAFSDIYAKSGMPGVQAFFDVSEPAAKIRASSLNLV